MTFALLDMPVATDSALGLIDDRQIQTNDARSAPPSLTAARLRRFVMLALIQLTAPVWQVESAHRFDIDSMPKSSNEFIVAPDGLSIESAALDVRSRAVPAFIHGLLQQHLNGS